MKISTSPGNKDTPSIGLQRPGGVGAEHDELAMSKVDHPDRAVDDREAQRREQQDRSNAEPGQDLFEDEFALQFPATEEAPGGRLAARTRKVDQTFFSTRPFSVQTWFG